MAKRKRKPKGISPWKRMAKCIDLPEFAVGLDECVEIWGGNTVQVEGAGGIHTYEPELVKIHMKKHLLVLHGSEFDLSHFGDHCMRITGKLQSICWEVK